MNKPLAIALLTALREEAARTGLMYTMTFEGDGVKIVQSRSAGMSFGQVLVAPTSNLIELGFDLARALAVPRVVNLTEHEKRLASEGDKIGAIKAVRQRASEEGYSMGLKDAKDLVDKVPCHRELASSTQVPSCKFGYSWCKCS